MPREVVPQHLPIRPKGRTIVVGAGKASAAMAAAVEDHWQGSIEGLVVTPYDHRVTCQQIEIIEAAHPVPDWRGQDAARRILSLALSAGPDDLVLCLISGGGSALLTLPAEGLTLADKQEVSRSLLASGATISEMNAVRKQLSAIKGGRLAVAAYPARVVSLVISDVPGDDPSGISSGPTVPDGTTFADARAILATFGVDPPPSVANHLAEARDETPKARDPRLRFAETMLVASPNASLQRAAERARAEGVAARILGDAIEGEAREVGRVMARIALSVRRHGVPVPPPVVLISGGETTVTIKGNGRGGRNSEFLAGLALGLDNTEGISALAADTDGIDGCGDNAGAFVFPHTLARARARRLDAHGLLSNNDCYALFDGLGDLFRTGPTLTNVNDFRAVMVEAEAPQS